MTDRVCADIPLAAIHVGRRLRRFLPEHAAAIAASIQVVGRLLNPIVVRPRGAGYALVVGWHRLEAVKLLGWESVPAVIRRDLTKDTALILEIDSNVCVATLSPAERALLAWEREELLERMRRPQRVRSTRGED
jgi:ParB family chromosome partitioning protein